MAQPSTIPALRHCLVQDETGNAKLVEIPMPPLLPGTVLIRTIAVALNPTDYKMGAAFPAPGAVIGQDFAGTVVAIAEGVDADFQVGDEVCGLSPGSFSQVPEHGAFASYVRTPAALVMRLAPTAKLSAEQSATVGTALATCTLALWAADALALLATPENPAEKPLPVLVYGGSTATGTIAIQLLRASGLNPIATCSPRNFDLVRQCGASAVFDYTRPDVTDSIKRQAGGRLQYVLDCIADEQSVEVCYTAMARVGGRYVSLEVVPDHLLAKRRSIHAAFVLGYQILGEEVKLPGGYGKVADPVKRDLWIQCSTMYRRLLDERKLRPHPMEILEGGLDKVLDGLALLKSGTRSGTKIVVKLL